MKIGNKRHASFLALVDAAIELRSDISPLLWRQSLAPVIYACNPLRLLNSSYSKYVCPVAVGWQRHRRLYEFVPQFPRRQELRLREIDENVRAVATGRHSQRSTDDCVSRPRVVREHNALSYKIDKHVRSVAARL